MIIYLIDLRMPIKVHTYVKKKKKKSIAVLIYSIQNVVFDL